MTMIRSAHRLTGFWFKSNQGPEPGSYETLATNFLSASLKTLGECNRCEGAFGGAIHTGFDPAHLDFGVPGYRWLSDRLQWMKRTYDDFDDKPGDLRDPGKRQEPFPAFHWSIRYPVGGHTVALNGVQVLVGHDVAVIREFSIWPQTASNAGLTQASPGERRFANPPDLSAALFIAAFCEVSGPGAIRAPKDEWPEAEFGTARFPGVTARLRCAVRDDGRCYRGCLLVGDPKGSGARRLDRDLYSELRNHIETGAFLTYLCTLLNYHAKFRWEKELAEIEEAELKRIHSIRANDVEALTQAHHSHRRSFSRSSVDKLKFDLSDDREKLLDPFDQAVATSQINAKAFEEVAPQLFEIDKPEANNGWAAKERTWMSAVNKNLAAAQKAHRDSYETTSKRLDDLQQSVVEVGPWTAVFGWPSVGAIVLLLIGVGWNVLSMSPPQYVIAQVLLTAATLILLARTGWWLAFEQPAGVRNPHLVAFVSLALPIIIISCLLSIRWISNLRKAALQDARETPTVTRQTVPQAGDEKEPTLPLLMHTSFPGVTKISGKPALKFADGSSFPIEGTLYIDFPAGSKFLGLYVPSSPRTFEISSALALRARQLGDELEKGALVMAESPGKTSHDIDALVYTGRIYLYHDDVLTSRQIEDVRDAFKHQQLDVVLRGPDYLATAWLEWRKKQNEKAKTSKR